jgi:hypothetical protein
MKEHATVTIQELLLSSLAQTDALAKLLIYKGIANYAAKNSCRRFRKSGATYQKLLNPIAH